MFLSPQMLCYPIYKGYLDTSSFLTKCAIHIEVHLPMTLPLCKLLISSCPVIQSANFYFDPKCLFNFLSSFVFSLLHVWQNGQTNGKYKQG